MSQRSVYGMSHFHGDKLSFQGCNLSIPICNIVSVTLCKVGDHSKGNKTDDQYFHRYHFWNYPSLGAGSP